MQKFVAYLALALVVIPIVMVLATAPWPLYAKVIAVAWPGAIVGCWYYLQR